VLACVDAYVHVVERSKRKRRVGTEAAVRRAIDRHGGLVNLMGVRARAEEALEDGAERARVMAALELLVRGAAEEGEEVGREGHMLVDSENLVVSDRPRRLLPAVKARERWCVCRGEPLR
jgi:hypothetical protein